MLRCYCNGCLTRLRTVKPYGCGATWWWGYGGGDKGGKYLTRGLLFFPLSGITVSSQANDMVGFVLLKQRTSMVVSVRTKLRGACRTLGSGTTALHAFSAMLPKTCPLPSIVSGRNSCGSKTALPSLSIAQSV